MIAPIVGILALVAVIAIWWTPEMFMDLEGRRGLVFAAQLYLIVGLPVAYGAEFIVGYPVYRWLANQGSVRLVWTIPAGAVAGILAYLPLMFTVAGQPTLEDAILAVGAGAIGGGVGGLTFWIVAFAGSASAAPSA